MTTTSSATQRPQLLTALRARDLLGSCIYFCGQWQDFDHTFSVIDPATQQAVATMAEMDLNAGQDIINYASSQQKNWQLHPDKVGVLRRWAAFLRQDCEILAALVTLEQGKPLAESRGEVTFAAAMLDWFASESERTSHRDLGSLGHANRNHRLIKVPVGLVTCITPWNFPVASVVVKCGAALAAGCAVVLKPAEDTPLIARALLRYAYQAGLTDGAFNIITTSRPQELSPLLTSSDAVAMVSFTGSTSTGKLIASAAGASLKRTAMELGGNAPFLVFADVDPVAAAQAVIHAGFYNCGQICIGANRILVEEELYPQFLVALRQQMARLVVGSGFDPQVSIGPLIHQQAKQGILRQLQKAEDQGATVEWFGQTEASSGFLAPALVTNAHHDMELAQQEVFGPVAAVYSFRGEDQGVALANQTKAGLAAYAYTRDHQRLERLGHALEAGMVGLNATDLCHPALPFGGIKESGYGREGGQGCLNEFSHDKTIVTTHI